MKDPECNNAESAFSADPTGGTMALQQQEQTFCHSFVSEHLEWVLWATSVIILMFVVGCNGAAQAGIVLFTIGACLRLGKCFPVYARSGTTAVVLTLYVLFVHTFTECAATEVAVR